MGVLNLLLLVNLETHRRRNFLNSPDRSVRRAVAGAIAFRQAGHRCA
jgi:hypothetical protein